MGRKSVRNCKTNRSGIPFFGRKAQETANSTGQVYLFLAESKKLQILPWDDSIPHTKLAYCEETESCFVITKPHGLAIVRVSILQKKNGIRTVLGQRLHNWKPFLETNLLASIGRDFGALKGVIPPYSSLK